MNNQKAMKKKTQFQLDFLDDNDHFILLTYLISLNHYIFERSMNLYF
jgi:hypothetical protein